MIDQYRSTLSTLTAMHPMLRVGMVHHRNTRGQPLTFRHMPYLIEMYTDMPKLDNVVIRKAVQTGVSELCIQLAIERSGWAGRIVAYVLPTYSIRDRFVQKRINPLLQHIPAYIDRAGGIPTSAKKRKSKGNLKLKKFGEGSMMFLGSNTPGDFLEFSADMLIIDEFDQCDPGNLAKARDRLRASPYPQEVRLGNPSLPRVGISRLYDESDARKWFFQCDRCNHRQSIDWFSQVVEQDDDGAWVPRDKSRTVHLKNTRAKTADRKHDIRPICLKCKEPFDRTGKGALWVPAHMDRDVRGYSMSRLDVLSDSLWSLLAEWTSAQGDSAKMSAFYTSVLGQPFEFSGARLTHAMLGDCAKGEALDYLGGADYKDRTVTAGIDVGTVLNVTISTSELDPNDSTNVIRQCRWVGAVRTFDEVGDLLRRYRVDVAVIDSAPEMRMAQGLRDHFNDSGETQVWLARFNPTPRVGIQKYGMRLDYQRHTVTVDRTMVFDTTLDDIRERRRIFPEDVFTVLGWSDQMRSPVRVLNELRQRIVWENGSSPDHYRLSDIYDRIAFDLVDMGGSYSAVDG